ncbi:LysR substrate-binding domain-containing protein [Psychromarinibacter sp. C21-152]|uniref:LysR substrate-binding domain-containing protein n=1 Tax=Psychromarinibacter sediminicola TaxID=3033385 RepID=A0AAE3NU61_9RHOB|nr:LysR substrate-binding domain-containing protein [Psychromarinibacter sediminicola]MDF0602071.1 LysR substrate-binding domain-containing protein [Psychromarinibacter sediminicola]
MPPLNALRAFEAASRHGGFIGASEELNVTRGAISRHVRLLEDHLGVQLFVRLAQGVRLTAAGRQLQPVLSEAFALIHREVERISSDASELRVICPPGTSIRWLLPKLEDFRSLHPDLRVRLTTDFYADGGFDPVETDVGFSVSNLPNRPKSLETQTLFPIMLTPACAPGYLKERSLTSPEALASCELLHENRHHSDWKAWTDDFPELGVDPAAGQHFPNIDLATKAAVMGIGIVMADLVLCREELEAGTLIAPFPDMVCHSPLDGICLLGGADKWHIPKVEAFKSWAHDTSEADRASVSHLMHD